VINIASREMYDAMRETQDREQRVDLRHREAKKAFVASPSNDPIVVLESLNPDGTTPAEILSFEGELGLRRLTGMLEVVGVLFELPN